MQNRVLVTGGAGFIGCHLVEELVNAGSAVTVLDNFSVGNKNNLLNAQTRGDVLIINGSVLDLNTVNMAMEGCDLVFHLAVECVRRSLSQPLENHHTNATGTINVLEIARRRKVKKFVYCSSSEVYGNSECSILNETTVCKPVTVYGASKLAGEYYTKVYYHTYHVPTIVVRPFNAYGPHAHSQGTRAEVIPRFVIRLLNNLSPIIFGDGNSVRDFTYVTEVARGLMLAANCDTLIGQEVNIAHGHAVTIQNIAAILAQKCNKQDINPIYLPDRPGNVYFLHADTQLASKHLGFNSSINIEEGLERYLNWFKENHTNVSRLLEENPINWQLPGEP